MRGAIANKNQGELRVLYHLIQHNSFANRNTGH